MASAWILKNLPDCGRMVAAVDMAVSLGKEKVLEAIPVYLVAAVALAQAAKVALVLAPMATQVSVPMGSRSLIGRQVGQVEDLDPMAKPWVAARLALVLRA